MNSNARNATNYCQRNDYFENMFAITGSSLHALTVLLMKRAEDEASPVPIHCQLTYRIVTAIQGLSLALKTIAIIAQNRNQTLSNI